MVSLAEEATATTEGSEALENVKHERFAVLVATGKSASLAYSKVYGTTGSVSDCNGSRLQRKAEVSARIRHLQAQMAHKLVMDGREMLEFLTEVKRTPVGNVTAMSPLCERRKVDKEGNEEIWMPSKLGAVQLAAKLQGLLVDRQQVDVSGRIDVVVTEERRVQLIEMRKSALEGGE